MIDMENHPNCNGCRLCEKICPVQAITIQADSLDGFLYPVIDKNKCIECRLCEKKCTQLHPVKQEGRKEPRVYAAWSNDSDVRMWCTSGGMFYELAAKMIQQDGLVCACRYTDDYRGAYHTFASTLEELHSLCGSKHVQSNVKNVYGEIKDYLRAGRKVMFVGTPCQVASLYRFIDGDSANLLTVDFICNSINSPKAQGRYIDWLEQVYGGVCIEARSKDKRYGWNTFGSSAKFDNGAEYYASRTEDPRVVGYHQGHLFIRESCTRCQYKSIPRNADITLGDFWGIEPDERNPKLEEGTSLVFLNSEKAEVYFDTLGETIGFYEQSFQKALAGNPSIYKNAKLNKKRAQAFAALEQNDYKWVVDYYKDKPDLLERPRQLIKKIVKKMSGRN